MSDLLDQIRAMSPEDQVEVGKIIKSAEEKVKQQKGEVRNLGFVHGPGWDPQREDYMHCGITLTEFNNLPPEKQYDLEHPLVLRQYGHSETFASWGKPQKTKYWSKKEVDEYNEEQKRRWLKEKQKVFPNATLD